MREKLILFWRKMKKVKLLKPVNKLIFYFASSNLFNVVMDFIERNLKCSNSDASSRYFDENRERFENNIACLYDEKSKRVYRNIVMYRKSHDRKYLRGIVDKKMYFDPLIINLTRRELFVDCGAYTGDTIKAFSKCMRGGGNTMRLHLNQTNIIINF